MISLGNIYKDPESDSHQNLNSQRQAKHKQIVLILSLVISGTLIVLLFFVDRTSQNIAKENTTTTSQTGDVFLTPDQIQTERSHLPIYPSIAPTLKTDANKTSTSSTVTILSDEEVDDRTAKSRVNTSDIIVPQTDGAKIPVAQSSPISANNNTEATTYTKPGSGIEVKNVSVSYANIEQNLSTQKRNGMLQAIDFSNHYFLIVTDSKTIKIYFSNETKVFINNKQISIASLQLGDVLEITGLGYTAVSELTAESINVVAEFESVTSDVQSL